MKAENQKLFNPTYRTQINTVDGKYPKPDPIDWSR